MRIRFVTSNEHKAEEAAEILRSGGIEVEWVDLEYPEIQADSLEEVVSFSLEWVSGRVETPFFIEDAGMFIDALSGFPGPYSSYVFRTIGNQGIIRLMEGVSNRRAKFYSVIGLVAGRGMKAEVMGAGVPGRIAERPRGIGWGFDPIFIPEGGGGLTYAEMGRRKNEISHRRRALELLADRLGAKIVK